MNGQNFMNITPQSNNTFCYYPFYAIAIKSFSGSNLRKVSPCCKMMDLGRSVLTEKQIKDLSLIEIFEHEKFEKLRSDSLNNIRNSNCQVCWRQEDKNMKSFRLQSTWAFDDSFKKDLREFDVSFSNKCNLSCRMCNTGSTHQLYKDKLFFEKNNLIDDINYASSNSFFPSVNIDTINNKQLNWLLENTDKIKVLKISGGEPLYEKKVLKLLNIMIEKGTSKNCVIQLHTNAFLLDTKNIEILNNFKYQSHTFSIDGVDSIYNYIRHYSSFDVVEKNIMNWLNESNNILSLNFNLVLTALNLMNLKEYFQWINDIFNFKYDVKVDISEARPFTRGTSICNLPIKYLKKSRDKIENFFEKFSSNNIIYDRENILIMIDNAIKNNKYDFNHKNLKKEIVLLDMSRNQKYSDYLNSELIEVIDGIQL